MNHEQPEPSTHSPPAKEGTSAAESAYRLQQQEMLVQFGCLALKVPDFLSLLQEATRMCAEGLNTRFCKAMEYLPDEDRFIVRAGVGWKPDTIGSRTDADLDCPAGYAFHRGEAVIAGHPDGEGRFRTPRALQMHVIERSICVPIPTASQRFGVLEADSTGSQFSEADVAFMRGLASILAGAHDRARSEAAIRTTEERYLIAAKATKDVIWDWDLVADRVLWNEALATLFGHAEVETDGSWWKDHIHPDDRERVVSAIGAAIASGQETWAAEYRFLKAHGSEAFVFDRGFVIRDGTGRAIRMIGSMFDLTERRRAEEALRRSEERLRGALSIRTVGVMFWGDGNRLTEVNDAFLQMTGFSREEAIGKAWQQLTPKEFHEPSLKAVEELTVLGESTPYEKQYFRKDGSRWWGLFAARRVGDQVVEFVLDVTNRKQAEEHRRASEARFQAIANSIDQIVWSASPDGDYDFVNQRWYDYTGVPEGAFDRNAWATIFHTDDQARAWAQWRRCLATGDPYHIEYRLRHRSGQYRWVLARAVPVRDDKGRITRWFGTCTDIQEIVEAREIMARSREELEQEIAARTEERDRIWQNSSELMAVFGFDGTRRVINPAWSRMLGYDEGTLLNTPIIDTTHPDDRPRRAKAIRKLADGESIAEFVDRQRHADGSYRTISWTGVPGEGVFYGIGRDITEQRRAEEALRQAQKMEAIGQLTGGVAHDFNNLLTIVRSSVEFLRRPNLPEERRTRYIDAISDTVGRASKLTGQLLAFARRQALKPEVFDVPQRLGAITDMLRTIVGARIQIMADIACEHCCVEADVTQFETALVNMAVNARDAMNGEGTLRVRMASLSQMPSIRGHAGGPGRFVALSISDTGEGIPADRIDQIFEPFFTTKEVGKGTGLGLSQVYGFAKQSGGDVAVESKVGEGTTFTLYMPRTDRDIATDASNRGRERAQGEEGRGCRVLVVEDNLEVGRFSTQLLQDLGYETTWAVNACEALILLKEDHKRFDVVFSDVVMPGMSGVDLAREIRRGFPDLPVVLTSGYSNVLAAEGRDGFELLHKPYALDDVSRVLIQVTRRRAPSPLPDRGSP